MSIALSIGNNLTTGGVFTADAVNNTSVTNVTDFASVPGGGVLKLLSTQTASASASISFTSGIDSTYDSYVFKFINIHASTDNSTAQEFKFNMSTDGGSNYNVTKTTTAFRSGHNESDTTTQLDYVGAYDLAQGTGFQTLTEGDGIDNDQANCGELWLYNPSSTTFVKHYMSKFNVCRHNDFTANWFTAGYGNTTSAVNAIQFKFLGGNIDSGIIKMYGVV